MRALGLLSGGLDSQLAVKVLQQQGIEVRAIVFENPFNDISAAVNAAAALQVPLRVYDFTDDMLRLLADPPHGFGKCMNPCIDCHALMLRRAGELLDEEGCRFLFTGEVLNERPMSQTRRALGTVAAESAFGDLVLRPLSALGLPPTLPEREGWVDRSRLLDLNGRRRTAQFALARDFVLENYPSPAGGCLLTEPTFCVRLRELRDHEGLGDRMQVRRLRVGRHFRLESGDKFILGRCAEDNERLEAMVTPADAVLRLADGRPGPTGILPGTAAESAWREAAAMTAFYGKSAHGRQSCIEVCRHDMEPFLVDVEPMDKARVDAFRIA